MNTVQTPRLPPQAAKHYASSKPVPPCGTVHFKPSMEHTMLKSRIAKPAPPLRWALAALSLSMLLSSLGTSIANVGLPTLAQAFDAPFQNVQWVVLAYLLAITTLIVSVGRLGDLVGRKRLLLGGIALFTLASCLCGM